MEPFLTAIEDIVQTKAHLAELVNLSLLEKLPFVELGLSWDKALSRAPACCTYGSWCGCGSGAFL